MSRDRGPHAWARVRRRLPPLNQVTKRLLEPWVHSEPANLDQVSKRLEEWLLRRSVDLDQGPAADEEPRGRLEHRADDSITPSTASGYEENQRQKDLRWAAETRNAFFESGGRLLSDHLTGDQFDRWQDFRRLQRFARGQSAYDYWRGQWEDARTRYRIDGVKCTDRDGRDLYSEKHWDFYWQKIQTDFGDHVVVYVSGSYCSWFLFVQRGRYIPEQRGFPEYVEALKERLAKHGFTRTFHLDKDPDRQDKLTTWIEYLGYEYWWLDQYTDKKAEERLDMNLFWVFETEDYLVADIHIGQLEKAKDNAEKRLESAKVAVMVLRRFLSELGYLQGSSSRLRQRLFNAEAKVERAVKEYNFIEKRYHRLIGDSSHMDRHNVIKNANTTCQSILLQSLVKEVPLIELELNSEAAKKHCDEVACMKKLKRGRTAELDEEQQIVKKQRHVDKIDIRDSAYETHTASIFQRNERPKRGKTNNVDDEVIGRETFKRKRTVELDEEEQVVKKQRHVDKVDIRDFAYETHTASISQRGERPKRGKTNDEVAWRRTLKRGRTAEPDEEEQVAKKQRHVDKKDLGNSNCATHTTSNFQRGETSKRSKKTKKVDDGQVSKPPKHASQNTALYNGNTSNSRCTRASTRRSKQKIEANDSSGPVISLRRSEKPTSLNALQPMKVSKPVRRSARIAEREKRLRAAIEAQSVQSNFHSRTPKAIQVPTASSSADPQDRNPRSRAKVRAKNARAKRKGH